MDFRTRSKSHRAWNLHHAVKDIDLDFFVMFGSISGTVGAAGQANYAAANEFLDAFARFRRQNGLAASVLNPGVVDEVGMVWENPEVLRQAYRAHMQILSEVDILSSVHLAIRNYRCEDLNSCSISVGVGVTESGLKSSLEDVWQRDARLSLCGNLQGAQYSSSSTGSSHDRLRVMLEEIDKNPCLLNDAEFAASIKAELTKGLVESIATNQDLNEEQQGNIVVNSLMAIEIRTLFRRRLKIDIPTAEITKAGTVKELCKVFIRHARMKYKLDEDDGIPSPP